MNIFTVEKPEYKLNELAEKLSIAPSTVHRLLTTLRSEGFVVKDSFLINIVRYFPSCIRVGSH